MTEAEAELEGYQHLANRGRDRVQADSCAAFQMAALGSLYALPPELFDQLRPSSLSETDYITASGDAPSAAAKQSAADHRCLATPLQYLLTHAVSRAPIFVRAAQLIQLRLLRSSSHSPAAVLDDSGLPTQPASTTADGGSHSDVAAASGCIACKVSVDTFSTKLHQRVHFGSDWHRKNVKRRQGGKTPLSEQDFAAILDEHGDDVRCPNNIRSC